MVDLLVITVILFMLFSFSIVMWNSGIIRIFEREKKENLEAIALAVSDQLIKSLGFPEDWEKATEYTPEYFTAGLWHLNEGSGQVVKDSSFFGNDGILGYTTAVETYDPEWSSDCKFKNCLSYKGLEYSRFVKVPVADGTSLDIRGSITVEAWIFLNDVSGQQSIADRYRNYALWIDQGYVRFALGYGTDNEIEVQSNNKVSANRWNHVAGVYDHENKEVRIYINGFLDKIDTGKQITSWTIAPNEPLYLGNGNVIGSLASPLNGKIDEVRISKTARRSFNVGDIFALGLAYDTHTLNREKVVKFVNLDYETAKNLLGKYDFSFKITCLNGYTARINGLGLCPEPIAYVAQQFPQDVAIMYILNNSGLVWDFYWGGGNLPVPAASLTARYVYATDNKERAYKWAIRNISNYNTIISEDTHVKDTDLTSSEQQALKDFISSGKTYFHVQHELDLLKIFNNLLPEDPGRDEGTIVSWDDVLHNISLGTNVTFQQKTKTFDIATSPLPLKVLMKVREDASNCIFCKWSYGRGRIYYLPDINVTSPVAGYVPGLDLVGRKIEIGENPSGTVENIISLRRIALLENQTVFVDLKVWR